MSDLVNAIDQAAPLLFLILAVLLLYALYSISVLKRRVEFLANRHANLTRGVDGANLLDTLDRQLMEFEQLRQGMEHLERQHQSLALDQQLALRHLGLVRFNPFDDLGGNQSFALAAMDDHGDGFVISSIFGRNDSRIYAKSLENGRAQYTLSEEESQAIQEALARRDSARPGRGQA